MREIVLIEDSDQDAELIQQALQETGVKNPVVRRSDGAEAVEYLRAAEQSFANGGASVPAILLVDLNLPGVTGFEILADLQGRKFFDKTLRVVLSDLQSIEQIRRAYAIGANSFLGKPINPQDLQELIKTYPDYWALE